MTSQSFIKRTLFLLPLFIGLIFLVAPMVSKAYGCSSSSDCASGETCFFPNTVNAYCQINYNAQGSGGTSSNSGGNSTAATSVSGGTCSFNCCSDNDCNFNANTHCLFSGTAQSYCTSAPPLAGPMSPGVLASNAECVAGTQFSSLYGTQCLAKQSQNGRSLYITVCQGNETAGACAPARINKQDADTAAAAAGPGCRAELDGLGGAIDPNTGLSYFYSTVCDNTSSNQQGGGVGQSGSGASSATQPLQNFLNVLQLQLLSLLKGKLAILQNPQNAQVFPGTNSKQPQATLGGSSSSGAQGGVGAGASVAVAPLSIEVNPLARNIGSAGSVTYGITVHSDFGTSDIVSLSLSGLPKGASGFFAPQQVMSNNGKSTLTVNVTNSAAIDLYTLRVTATMADGSQKSTSFSIAIGATKNLDPNSGIVTPPVGVTVFGLGTSGTGGTSVGGTVGGGNTGGTGGTATCPAGTPSFALLANCSRDITVNVGDTINYAWSANTPSATSSYTMDYGVDTCYTPPRLRQISYPWDISTTSGQMTSIVKPCQAGVTYTVNFITIDAAGNKLAYQNIIRVNSPVQVSFAVSPTSLNFTFPSTIAGSQPQIVVFNIPSGQSIPYVAASSVAWLTVPSSGTALMGSSALAYITLGSSASSLSPGTYTGTVTFSPSPNSSFTFSPQTVNVTLTVNAH